MSTNLSKWRFLAGAAQGVVLWCLVAFVATAVVDHYIWGAVHHDQSGMLAYNLWWGMTPEALHDRIITAAMLLVPAGVLLQIRPPIAALATRRAAIYGTIVAVLVAAGTCYYMVGKAFSWMWVLQD